MCCYKDYKNFEKFNNIVQVILHRAIKLIQQLPKQRLKEKQRQLEAERKSEQNKEEDGRTTKETDSQQTSGDEAKSIESNECKATTEEKNVDDNAAESEPNHEMTYEGQDAGERQTANNKEKVDNAVGEEKVDGKQKCGEQEEDEEEAEEDDDEDEDTWTLEECDNMFLFVSKVFLMNFPLYMAYKHCVHSTLEELSQQEASALNNYCELSVS